MMYDYLAPYYDALVADEEATKAWVQLIEKYIPQGEIMELACGSGEITIMLANHGYQISASDLSAEMIEQAKKKENSDKVKWSVMDMSQIEDDHIYDGILCLCDSFNYLLKEEAVEQMIAGVSAHIKENGYFIMDMHSLDRLEEFSEEYNEAGRLFQHEYQWCIQSEDDFIYQNFSFYDEAGRCTLEQHIQRVYDPLWVLDLLTKYGFECEIFTDFELEGIQPGEKYFYICRKVKS